MVEAKETLVIADIEILTHTACFLQKKGDNTPRGKKTPTEGKEKTNITDDLSMLLRLLDSPLDVKKVNPVRSFILRILKTFTLIAAKFISSG